MMMIFEGVVLCMLLFMSAAAVAVAAFSESVTNFGIAKRS